MDTLDGTSWDVVIAGTGLQPALLALALSRSGKKVLHLDSNAYYGDHTAALSIDEAEEWVARGNPGRRGGFPSDASLQKPLNEDGTPRLSSTRGYSICLSPCILYTKSELLPALVSSKAHEQLEFLAIGSWFVFKPSAGDDDSNRLLRVPNNREDIFSNTELSLRAKGALVKFLRFVIAYDSEENKNVWDAWKDKPLIALLADKFRIPPEHHAPLLALSMSTTADQDVLASAAVQNIHRHLTSMGIFGAGFSAVLPKYGGLAEIIQVACRAAAVGGAVYVLDRCVQQIESSDEGDRLQITFAGNDKISTPLLFGTPEQLPITRPRISEVELDITTSRSISIIDSRLESLFPPPERGGLPPSAAVVVMPPGSITHAEHQTNECPIHIFAHSSDTGECPVGKCILYSMTITRNGNAAGLLNTAIKVLLGSLSEGPKTSILWSISFDIQDTVRAPTILHDTPVKGVHIFVEAAQHPVFDDRTLQTVEDAWRLTGPKPDELFLKFSDCNAGMPDERTEESGDSS